MRIALVYGRLRGGGCERRMGDICRWLLDHGDEAYILAVDSDEMARVVIQGHCGVPASRCLYMPPGGVWEEWLFDNLLALEIDLADVQWAIQTPPAFPCAAIATLHGMVSIPPNGLMQGILAVENSPALEHGSRHAARHYVVVENWVNLHRFPFRDQLGEGLVFVGRSFKMCNVRKTAPYYDGIIDCYGTVTEQVHIDTLPPNVKWNHFADTAEVLPRYRVLFGTAQVAMEGMAAGRLVVCGQDLHLPKEVMGDLCPEGRLVLPSNVEQIAAAGQFNYRRGSTPTAAQVWDEVRAALRHDYTKERRVLRQWVEQRANIDTQIGRVRDFYETTFATWRRECQRATGRAG